jgi:uncharacterized membrane protein
MALHRNHHSIISDLGENHRHVLHSHSLHNLLALGITSLLAGLIIISFGLQENFFGSKAITFDAGTRSSLLTVGTILAGLGFSIIFVQVCLCVIKSLLHSIHHNTEFGNKNKQDKEEKTAKVTTSVAAKRHKTARVSG